MKRIDNEKILDIIYDLADANGMRIDEFMDSVESQFGGEKTLPDDLPEDIAAELMQAREDKKLKRAADKQSAAEAEMAKDIKTFKELFPETSADDIPDEVWEDVANGISLPYAYALYKAQSEKFNDYAEGVNKRNSDKGAKAYSDGSTEPVFTKEQVEKMSDKDIKKNYKGIISAMKNWRYN